MTYRHYPTRRPGREPRRPTTVGPPYGTIIDTVNARDRRYFERHPHESCYLRRYRMGEFSPAALAAAGAEPPDQDAWVLVFNLAPGVRSRRLLGAIVGQPLNGRMTLIGEAGLVAANVAIVGWEGGQ